MTLPVSLWPVFHRRSFQGFFFNGAQPVVRKCPRRPWHPSLIIAEQEEEEEEEAPAQEGRGELKGARAGGLGLSAGGASGVAPESVVQRGLQEEKSQRKYNLHSTLQDQSVVE